MPPKTYAVAEARRQLSTLIQRAASGRGPIYIGRRGDAEVALVAVERRTVVAPRSLRGLCTLVDEDLAPSDQAIGAAFDSSLAATEAALLTNVRHPRSGRRRARQ